MISLVYHGRVERSRADPPSKLRFDRLSLEDGLPHLVVLSMLQDRQGFLWIATQAGVARLDGYGEGQHATVFRHDRGQSD